MNRQHDERMDQQTGKSILTGYVERELRPVDPDEEAGYLSEQCHIPGTDAFEFICSRDGLYTDCGTDAEFILSNCRTEIESRLGLTYGNETDRDRSTALLYHANLYRLDSSTEKEEFRRWFPTVSSLEEIYETETRCMNDD